MFEDETLTFFNIVHKELILNLMAVVEILPLIKSLVVRKITQIEQKAK